MNEEEKSLDVGKVKETASSEIGLKWGDEAVSSDVDQYTYQDPTAIKNSQEEQPIENSSTERVIPPVTSLVMPTTQESVSTGSSSDQNAPVDAKEEVSNRNVSSLWLVLLFVFLLLFVLFLPDIANYINLALTRNEVQGTKNPTPTLDSIPPISSSTPTPNEPVLEPMTVSLEEIVTGFSQSEAVRNIKAQNSSVVLDIQLEDDTITITYQDELQVISHAAIYQLSRTVLVSENADTTTASILIDVIGSLQGQANDLGSKIFEGGISDYTMEKNGIFLVLRDDGAYHVQIDLAKTLNLS